MSKGEQIADRPDRDPQDPTDFIDAFREQSRRVRSTLGEAARSPSRQTMAAFEESVAETQTSVHYLYRKDFFRATQDPFAVSGAVGAWVDSIRDGLACVKILDPEDGLVIVVEYGELSDVSRLVISHTEVEEATAIDGHAESAEHVNELADLILAGDFVAVDKLSAQLSGSSDGVYEMLLKRLPNNPRIGAYLEREARKERYKDMAVAGGGIALAAFVGSLAAGVTKDLFVRRRN